MYLPFDIWQHIAQFIPHEILWTLYSVNSAFFDLAMEERYRDVSFGPEDGDIMPNFVKLQDPVVASRVRSIYFRPTVFLADGRSLANWVKRALVRTDSNGGGPLIGSERKTLKQMSAAFDAIVDLRAFHLHCWPSDDSDTIHLSVPFIHAAFTCVGRSLRELVLDASLEALGCALNPSLIFTGLETLVIRFCKSYRLPPAVKVLRDTVIPFVNNHHSTLRTFDLAEPNFKVTVDFDVTALFFGMTHFLRLRKLLVGIPLNGPETIAFRRFLDLHKTQISHLEILNEHALSFYDGGPLFGLRHLVLAKPSFTPKYEKLISFLQMSGGYLTCLVLSDYQIGYNAALDVFPALSQCEMLQELFIRADLPDSYFLNLLAESLPNLYTVHLAVHRDDTSIRSLFGYDTDWRYPPVSKLRRLRIVVPNEISKKVVVQCQYNFRVTFPGIHCTLVAPEPVVIPDDQGTGRVRVELNTV
ncbi:hypothetical protein BDZ94DRAFT_1325960 [Collybia nuda]|uniref:F-box domain-containing protein n=1 Tax=Collybia nuda TaxID=64659 RepID=A0A9P5XW04_9AGAR|nr:hypothetical protein BDZ94DRAFT_1325960 [Collybia nuda]